MTEIVRDDEIRSGQPRLDGTRITVLDLKRRVIDAGDDPHVVAGEYDIELADLFRALAYYYDDREAFAERERQATVARRAGEAATRELLRDIEGQDATEQPN
jgi:uncharacterized protein (DUF433 family)